MPAAFPVSRAEFTAGWPPPLPVSGLCILHNYAGALYDAVCRDHAAHAAYRVHNAVLSNDRPGIQDRIAADLHKVANMAPHFFNPVSIRSSPRLIETGVLLLFTLLVMLPAPIWLL